MQRQTVASAATRGFAPGPQDAKGQRAKRKGSISPGQTEPEVVVRSIGAAPEAVGRAHVVGEVEPGTPANHPARTPITILSPLPNITRCVMKPKWIWLE